MADLFNVLVFPAGGINAVELHDSLATSVTIQVFGATSIDTNCSFIFERYARDLPMIHDPTFLAAFNELIEKWRIDLILSTHDEVAAYLAEHQDRIKAKLVQPDARTTAICQDKQKTYDLFADCRFVPKTYPEARAVRYPAFAKPRMGAGGVGSMKIETPEQLALVRFEQCVVAEFLPGEEYTVDCLTDRNGVLVVVAPRSRDRLLGGVAVHCEERELTGDIAAMAAEINSRLRFRGLWYFQIKRDREGLFKLMEICARNAGGMCFTRATGRNLALMSVYVALGRDVEALKNPCRVVMDRTLVSRYRIDYDYDKVYTDFDDTVIVRGKVNLMMMMFLYQCRNAGIPVHLITKHAKAIEDTLGRFGISRELFADIIHLGLEDRKPSACSARKTSWS